MINKIIRNFLAKQIAGRSDDGIMITLRDPQKVELLENIMADLLMRNGIDPKAITSEAQLKTILNQIEAMTKQSTTSGIRNTQSAKVFDLEGKEIKNTDNIMGGKEIKFDDDLPPPGSRGGKDDIAAPIQSSEESLRDMMIAENKKNINKIKQRQKMLNEAIDDASPGFSGDRKVDAELVAENLAERMGLVYDDLPTKQRLDLYDQAYTGLSKKRPVRRESLEDFVDDAGGVDPDDPRGIDDFIPDDDPEPLAKGGRVGLKGGADASQYDKSPSEQKSVDISPSGSVTLGSGPPEGPDDRASADQDMIQMLVRQGYTPEEINAITNPTVIDKVKQSRFNNPVTRGILRTGAYLYNPTLAGIDFRRAMQLKNLYDVTKDSITNPEITEEDMQFAKGGIARIGLKDGMNRRTFLKLLGGAMSIPIVGKILKPFKIGKTVTKVPIIKTDNVPGKPEWFDQLVNKVILEGDEVTKRFATKDREIVHMKVLDEGTGGKEFPPGTPGSDDISIMVTQDLDAGAVRVEYRNPENMYGDPVQLRYKKPNPDEGDPRPSAEFDTAESIPVARADGPDDYAIDIDEGGGQSIKDLTSDVSKLKEYATGQKQTLKEFVQSKKRKDKARAISQGEGEAEQDFIINRQGEEIVEYPEPDFDDAFASGGIARMLGE